MKMFKNLGLTPSIAYTKGSTPKVKMEFKIDFEILEGQTLDVKVKAEGTDDINFPEKTITLEPGKSIYTYTEQASDGSWPNTIKYYPPTGAFTLTWKFNIMGTEYTDDTKNRAYVTAATPTCSSFNETLFYYACHNPDGNAGTDGKAVTHLIWNDFATKSMARIDSSYVSLKQEKLLFKNPGGGVILKDGSGVCGAWAEFFRDVLRVHAYASEKVDIDTIGMTLPDGVVHPDPYWLVNDQTISNASLTSNGSAVPGPDGINKGQGDGCSVTTWSGHSIAKAFGEMYDPAYGKGPCADEAAYEALALPGFRYEGPHWLTGVSVDKYIKKDASKRLNYKYIP